MTKKTKTKKQPFHNVLVGFSLLSVIAGLFFAIQKNVWPPTLSLSDATLYNDILIRAKGDAGKEVMQLRINGQSYKKWTVGRSYDNYILALDKPTTINELKVEFTNDKVDRTSGIDYNLHIDYIKVNGKRYDTEHETTTTKGTWDKSTGCAKGQKKSQTIHCNGWAQYNIPAGTVVGKATTNQGGSAIVGTEIDLTKVKQNKGFAYTVSGKNLPSTPSTSQNRSASKLKIYEDGKEVGPGNASHNDIRNNGKGRYSDWQGSNGFRVLYFSASDNSDPRKNGKRYSYAVGGSVVPANPVCGNGQVESGEQCDDANARSGDGCSNICQIESDIHKMPIVISPSEAVEIDGDSVQVSYQVFGRPDTVKVMAGTSTTTASKTGLTIASDHFFNTGSHSKDAPQVMSPVTVDGLPQNDQPVYITVVSEKGTTKFQETISIVSKSKGVTNPVCGNGQVESGEQCDDANTRSGDGCSNSCLRENTSVSDGMTNKASDGRLDNSFPQAFPGAMGGGKFASGGRGGKVVVVNTRKNDCDSSNNLTSLNEALSMTGPRYITFAVDGIVELAACGSKSPSSMGTFYMSEQNSDVTVACQTAPGKMVIRVSSLNHNNGMSNAIYRHCAFRGDRVTGGNSRSNQRAVAIFPNKKDSTNLIFDHNTFSWTDDDVFQVYVSPTATGSAKDITVQHSIAAEGDSDSASKTSATCNSGSGTTCKTKGQSFDAQSGGMNALGQSNNGYKVENVTFTHNLGAHNSLRNFEFKGHVIAEASNNISYNWRTKGMIWQPGYKTVPTQIRGKNNLIIRGPETQTKSDAVCHSTGTSGFCPIVLSAPRDSQSGSDIANNYFLQTVGSSVGGATLLPDHPQQNKGTFTADNILTTVIETRDIRTLAKKGSTHTSCIGASKPVRHEHDQRIIDEMYAGKGSIGIGKDIRSYTNVINATTHDTVTQRDWSEYTQGSSHPTNYDTDNDGMADAWEAANGLSVGAKDHNGDVDNDGYKNIEEYFNYMARC